MLSIQKGVQVMNKIGFKPIPAAIALGLALLIWFAIPVPDGVTPQAWHLLAMFVGVIAAIIGKAMPIGALAIMVVMLVGVTQDTFLLESALPGFDKFKELVLKLRKEENFSNSEAESLFHFWSFITGLAVLANSPIGQDLDPQAIQSTIEHMLDIYIKGEQS